MSNISELIRQRFARAPGQPTRWSPDAASGAEQLKRILQDDFCQSVIDGSLHVLENSANPIRLNPFLCAIRELFTNILHAFAPEEAVEACSWFKPNSKDGRPTRRQRAIYMAQGGLADEAVGALHGTSGGTAIQSGWRPPFGWLSGRAKRRCKRLRQTLPRRPSTLTPQSSTKSSA